MNLYIISEGAQQPKIFGKNFLEKSLRCVTYALF